MRGARSVLGVALVAVLACSTSAGARRASSAPPEPARKLGAIDPELIRQVMRNHASQVSACYEQQLALHPELGGTVTLSWIIDADGNASEFGVERERTTLVGEDIPACIILQMVTWEFPRPRGGDIAMATYFWILRPSPQSPGGSASGSPTPPTP